MNAEKLEQMQSTEVERKRKLLEATVDWIVSFGAWQLFFTFTFSIDVSPDEADRRFRDYFRRAAKRIGDHFDIVFSCGRQMNGRLHFHALVKRRKKSDRRFEKYDFYGIPWKGNLKIEKPRSQRKVVEYLFREQHDTWEKNTICPRTRPCRRTTCRESEISLHRPGTLAMN